MPYIQWDDSFLINIPEIDMQHEKLVGLINILHAKMLAGQGNHAVKPVLSSLIKYVLLHFSREEQLMKSRGYPQLSEHKAKHDTYTNEINRFVKLYKDDTPLLARKVLMFLGDWARNHIKGEDRGYIPYLSDDSMSDQTE